MPPSKLPGPPKHWSYCPECGRLFGWVVKGPPQVYCGDRCKRKRNWRNWRLKYLKVNGVSYQHVEYVRRKKRNARKVKS